MAEITAKMIQELRKRTGVGMAKCKAALEAAGGDMDKAIDDLRKAGMAQAVKKADREANEGKIAVYETDDAIALIEVNAETDFVVNNEAFQKFVDEMAEEVAKTKPASLEGFLAQKFSKDSGLTIDELRAVLVQKIGENIQIRRIEVHPKKEDRSLGYYSHIGGKVVTLVSIEGAANQSSLSKEVAMHVAAANPEFLSPEKVPQETIDREKEIAREQLKGKPENIMDKILEGKINAFFDQVCLTRQKFIKDDSVSIDELVAKEGKQAGSNLKITAFSRWAIGE